MKQLAYIANGWLMSLLLILLTGCGGKTTTLNHPPSAQNIEVSTSKNHAVTITLQGSDEDNQTLSYTVTVQPQHGTLSGTAPDRVH